MSFKQTIAISITTLLLCTGMAATVCGQVTVTGHITAEVIESAHASSTVVTTSTLTSEQVNTESLQLNGTYRNTDVLNLGAVTIHAGLNTAYDIKLYEATLSDNNGNSFTIKPVSITSGQSDTLRADGSQSLLLNGTASLGHGSASGLYRGSYTVVVLYN